MNSIVNINNINNISNSLDTSVQGKLLQKNSLFKNTQQNNNNNFMLGNEINLKDKNNLLNPSALGVFSNIANSQLNTGFNL